VPQSFLLRLLLAIGVLFLVFNVRAVANYVRFLKLRSNALLTWPPRRPPLYGLLLGMGVILGLLVFFKLVVERRPPFHAFGELMMFAYYGYLLPLTLRIGRGFYEQGIWLEDGFVPYSDIGGLSWREQGEITLLVVRRTRRLARPLFVPRRHYAEARRLLRDRIASRQINFEGGTLDLGGHDERDRV
jgi:hypothetical protein